MNIEDFSAVKSKDDLLKQSELMSALVDYAKAEKVLKNVDEKFKKFAKNCETIERTNQSQSFYKSSFKSHSSKEKNRLKCLVDNSISRIYSEIDIELTENKQNLNSEKTFKNLNKFGNMSSKKSFQDNNRNVHVNKSPSSINLKIKRSDSKVKQKYSHSKLIHNFSDSKVKENVSSQNLKIEKKVTNQSKKDIKIYKKKHIDYDIPRINEIKNDQEDIHRQRLIYKRDYQTCDHSLNNHQLYNNHLYGQSYQNDSINYLQNVPNHFTINNKIFTQSSTHHQQPNQPSITKFIKGVNGKLIPLAQTLQYSLPNITSNKEISDETKPLSNKINLLSDNLSVLKNIKKDQQTNTITPPLKQNVAINTEAKKFGIEKVLNKDVTLNKDILNKTKSEDDFLDKSVLVNILKTALKGKITRFIADQLITKESMNPNGSKKVDEEQKIAKVVDINLINNNNNDIDGDKEEDSAINITENKPNGKDNSNVDVESNWNDHNNFNEVALNEDSKDKDKNVNENNFAFSMLFGRKKVDKTVTQKPYDHGNTVFKKTEGDVEAITKEIKDNEKTVNKETEDDGDTVTEETDCDDCEDESTSTYDSDLHTTLSSKESSFFVEVNERKLVPINQGIRNVSFNKKTYIEISKDGKVGVKKSFDLDPKDLIRKKTKPESTNKIVNSCDDYLNTIRLDNDFNCDNIGGDTCEDKHDDKHDCEPSNKQSSEHYYEPSNKQSSEHYYEPSNKQSSEHCCEPSNKQSSEHCCEPSYKHCCEPSNKHCCEPRNKHCCEPSNKYCCEQSNKLTNEDCYKQSNKHIDEPREKHTQDPKKYHNDNYICDKNNVVHDDVHGVDHKRKDVQKSSLIDEYEELAQGDICIIDVCSSVCDSISEGQWILSGMDEEEDIVDVNVKEEGEAEWVQDDNSCDGIMGNYRLSLNQLLTDCSEGEMAFDEGLDEAMINGGGCCGFASITISEGEIGISKMIKK